MILANGAKQYLVDHLVAKSAESNFYICSRDEHVYLLQVATEIEQNPKLDFAAYVLKELKKASDIYETQFQIQHPGERLDYDWLFPTVADSFLSKEQGNRRMNILSINGGGLLDQMIPLSSIRQKDRKVIDLATSIWVMGRLLRLLVLAHDRRISLVFDSGNVIIEPDLHQVVVFNWNNSKIYVDEVPEEDRMDDISSAAAVTLMALGEGTKRFDDYCDNAYVSFLKSLVNNPRDDTKQAYLDFESTHGKLFERIFYPFTTFSI